MSQSDSGGPTSTRSPTEFCELTGIDFDDSGDPFAQVDDAHERLKEQAQDLPPEEIPVTDEDIILLEPLNGEWRTTYLFSDTDETLFSM